ncbi:MAG: SIR2 family protein [Candidatus Aceula meridiana]|nr:SIR2 family protein [Candidatus Aceula meridiana]
MSQKSDVVLFLGAGFSRDAGLPTMANFGVKAKDDHNGLEKHLGKDNYREAAPLLVNSSEVFEAFQEYCSKADTITKDDIDNMEKIFCIAEMMKETGVPEIQLNDGKCSIDDLLESIKLWLWKIYQQCPFINNAIKSDEEIYNEFFKTIKNKKIDQSLTVITTNYDLIFEYSANKNGIKCCYPFEHSDAVEVVRAGGDGEEYIDLYASGGVSICKLHGSINFFQNVGESNSNKVFVANDFGDGTDIGRSGKWPHAWPAIFAVDAIWSIRKKYGNAFTPVIIPPTYAKLIQESWLRKMWGEALVAMAEAKKIIFIGYSMPVSDGFMEAFIHTSMVKRKESGLSMPEIISINPDEEAIERYKKLFTGCYNDKFGATTLKEIIDKNQLVEVFS